MKLAPELEAEIEAIMIRLLAKLDLYHVPEPLINVITSSTLDPEIPTSTSANVPTTLTTLNAEKASETK